MKDFLGCNDELNFESVGFSCGDLLSSIISLLYIVKESLRKSRPFMSGGLLIKGLRGNLDGVSIRMQQYNLDKVSEFMHHREN